MPILKSISLCYNKLMNKKVVGIICAVSTLFALNLGAVTFADNSTEFSLDVSSAALQLTVPPTASIELNPTSSSAVFGTANVTVNVATNNLTGYTLTMSVPSTNLTHSSLSNTVIPTLSSSTPESSFPANAWGYRVIDGNYLPILATNSPASWMVEEPTNGTDHTMTFAAKVDGTKPSGTYTNTLTFQAVANPNSPKLTIAFNGNGADGGTMNAFSLYPGASANLPVNTFTRSGYYFNGWNEKANATGVGYGNEDSVTAPNVINTPQTKTLYAQWVQDTGQGGRDISRTLQAAYEEAYVYNHGAFQEGDNDKHGLYVPEKDPVTGNYTGNYFEATKASDYEGIPANDLRFAIQDIGLLVGDQNVCERTTVIGSGAYVLDLRDFTSYHIAKLVDGKCWLLDNLALDPTLPAVQAKLIGNTNASDAAVTNFVNGGNPDSVAGWTSYAVSYETRWSTYDEPRVYASEKNIIPQGSDTMASDALNGGWKVGVYYNYCAASIGTYCYGYGAGKDTNPSSSIDLEHDICPSNWRIPTGANGGEYNVLTWYDGGYVAFRTMLRLPQSGYFQNESVKSRGSNSRYWTSTFNSNQPYSYMWIMDVGTIYYSPGFNTTTYTERPLGLSVRCVAK